MTTVVVVAMLVLLVLWAAAWALPPHRNCHECGTDRHWTQAHQVTGQPARAWCATCPWEWEARPGQDLADADTAMQEHRRNTEAGRTER